MTKLILKPTQVGRRRALGEFHANGMGMESLISVTINRIADLLFLPYDERSKNTSNASFQARFCFLRNNFLVMHYLI